MSARSARSSLRRRPAAGLVHRYDDLVFKQLFDVGVVAQRMIGCARFQSHQNDVVGALVQRRQVPHRRRHLDYGERRARITPGKIEQDRRQISDRDGFRTADAQFPACRVGQKVDVHHALFKFVERGVAASEQSAAVHGGLDASPAAVEQTDLERVFQIGNDLGNGRLRDAQSLRGPRHAAFRRDGCKNVEIAQPQMPSDPIFPIRDAASGVHEP